MNILEIGKVIKERRKFLKINQKEFSDIIGIGLRSLVDLENGKGNPTVIQLNKICDALGLKLEINFSQNNYEKS
jgi:transcriptional regulator with XRE-family HTH domain